MKPLRKPHAGISEDRAMPPTITLSGLCSEAADHVARARLSLSDEGSDADRALAHLDEAILCLRRLLAHGRAVVAKDERARPRA
ncbi:MAG TPA: hypothetical protein VFI85_01515 [Methyloceanibacter sp.]|nr:hypothetical protein [Methyloceanibacter sp.]